MTTNRDAPHAEVTAPAPAPLATGPRPPTLLWAALTAFAVAVAFAGYLWTGMPDYDAEAAKAEAPGPEQAAADAQHLDTMVDRLVERLKAQPDDVAGWTMLGRAHAMLRRPDAAADAFGKAVALKGDDPGLLADYAESLAMKDGAGLSGEPTKLIERSLALDAKHPKSLALAGAAAFDRKDYAQAVGFWERLVAVSPPEAEYLEELRGGIAEARRLGKLPGAPAQALAAAPAQAPVVAAAAPAGDAPAAAPGASISGTVTLAPALAARTKPDDTVFIFARAAEGQRMPLVILRHQVKDLPLQFSLDDSMAMQPSMKLSGMPRLVVVARVSRSGQAAAQPGDLSGQSAPLVLGAQGVRVEIAEVVGKP